MSAGHCSRCFHECRSRVLSVLDNDNNRIDLVIFLCDDCRRDAERENTAARERSNGKEGAT